MRLPTYQSPIVYSVLVFVGVGFGLRCDEFAPTTGADQQPPRFATNWIKSLGIPQYRKYIPFSLFYLPMYSFIPFYFTNVIICANYCFFFYLFFLFFACKKPRYTGVYVYMFCTAMIEKRYRNNAPAIKQKTNNN